ncbi:putative maltokinase [Caballeronia novacaledonica]|uniref:putative maltokinase n=1 Tax=Caballeronia novacaledonica TaxID=1544861 RepID=UPI001EE27E4E|nr:putative maltokinase [Caballeronia novacaledonica]GJH12833.1 putative maltokinase [Caballeronia novacaledonica]
MDDTERLQLAAYYLWEQEGRPTGRAHAHWERARQNTDEPSTTALTVTLSGSNNLSDLLSPENAAVIETTILPAYLKSRRWFAAKDHEIGQVRLLPSAASIDGAGLLTQIRVEMDGTNHYYALPLGILWGDEGSGDAQYELARKMSLAKVSSDDRAGILTDAFFMPRFVIGLLERIGAGHSVDCGNGAVLQLLVEDGFKDARAQLGGAPALRWLSAEQSNSSVIIGGRAVLKLLRRLEDGTHPEPEMCRFLTRSGYAHSSPLLGEVVQSNGPHGQQTLAILQGFVPNDGDAWTWAVAQFANEAKMVQSHPGSESIDDAQPSRNRARFEDVATMAGCVGLRLGELHAVLSGDLSNPAFAPEPATSADIESWRSATISQLKKAFDAIAEKRDEAVDRAFAETSRSTLKAHQNEILAAIESACFSDRNPVKARIHGDFHLGQVLLAGDDAYIIDFEGEPIREISQRRDKASPLRDVAGLLRSLAYAAAFSTKGRSEERVPSEKRSAAQSCETVRRDAEECFLKGYAASAPSNVGPSGPDSVRLLDLFLVEKAAYEICYEAANRPDWLEVPTRGLVLTLAAIPSLRHVLQIPDEAGAKKGATRAQE